MSKKEIVEFICDNCGAEAYAEEATEFKSALPLLWVTVQMIGNHGVQDPVDLCVQCREAFAKALLARRTSDTPKSIKGIRPHFVVIDELHSPETGEK